ncbi:MAG: MgtC/SapB family protein, partial [Phycisphaeraceae bacterium]
MTQFLDYILADAAMQLDMVLRLLVASLLGGVIGYEREVTRKAAGLRTMMLIALGAALLTSMSVFIAADSTFS